MFYCILHKYFEYPLVFMCLFYMSDKKTAARDKPERLLGLRSSDLRPQPAAHLLCIVGIVQSGFPTDLSGLIQCQNGLIHGHHTIVASGGNGVIDLSRIMLRIAGVMCMISKAGTSPPFWSGSSC